MPDVVLIRTNSIVYDSRVGKIIRSLNKKYVVYGIGWNREGIPLKTNDNNNLDLFSLKAPFGRLSLIGYLPLFWIWVLIRLAIYRPEVVHACDLDTVLPCYIYKVIFRKKLVFDVFDRYAMSYVPFLPPKLRLNAVYAALNSVEEFFGKRANVLVNVSEELLRTFRKRPKHCAIIMNCAEDQIVETRRSSQEKKENLLKLVYTGPIVRNRGFQNLSAAIKDLSRVELVIAGRAIDKDILNQIQELSNVKYKGLLPRSQALALEARSDVMVILYDLKDPINNFAMPNKLFEAMLYGLPVITNVATKLVNEVDCGIIVDYNNTNQIRTAIVCLRDTEELRLRLGLNSRNAFLRKYSWTIMEQELYKIYEALLSKRDLIN